MRRRVLFKKVRQASLDPGTIWQCVKIGTGMVVLRSRPLLHNRCPCFLKPPVILLNFHAMVSVGDRMFGRRRVTGGCVGWGLGSHEDEGQWGPMVGFHEAGEALGGEKLWR